LKTIHKQNFTYRALGSFLLNYGTLLGFVVVFAVFGIMSPRFATLSNFIMGTRQMAILFLMALGATFALVEGGFDLSIGSVVGIAAVLACGLQSSGFGVATAISAALGIAVLIGLVNAVNIVLLGITPFIATISMMFIIQGLELVYSGGRVITRGISDSYRFLGQGWIGPLPLLAIIAISVAVIAYILMSRTKFGRYAYAIGQNRRAVFLSGVSVNTYRMLLYVLAGLMGGIAGVLLGARLGSAPVWAGQKLLLQAYAAAFLGSSFGSEGEFGVMRTLLGAFLIAGLDNGLSMIGYGWYLQQIFLGLVLIMAISVTSLRKT